MQLHLSRASQLFFTICNDSPVETQTVVTKAHKRSQTLMGEGFAKSSESEGSPKFAKHHEFLQNATLKAKAPATSLGPTPHDDLVEKPLLKVEEYLFLIRRQKIRMGQWPAR